jgi:hypothetical protein
MKKALLALAVIVLLASVIAWGIASFRDEEAVEASGALPWPGGMGTLDAVAARFPPFEGNDVSRRLEALGNALPEDGPAGEFVLREVARGELTIGDPPPLPDVAAIRELLLREEVVWERRDVGIGDTATTATRGMLMTVARALVAGGLSKGRAGDPAAWDDLRAVRNLARSLDPHPQMMLQTAVLSMERTINAIAWKMPLPVPAWFEELQERDAVRPLLESFQHVAASYRGSGARIFPTKWLARSVEHDRRIAEELFRAGGCEVDVPMNELGADLRSVWQRAFRYRAEREATANALRVRKGEPVEADSRCGDGEWTFDGTTLRFSRQIASPASEQPMPLVLRVEPASE